MKNIILLVALLFSLNSFSAVVATCNDGQFPIGEGENGEPVWEPVNVSIIVNKMGKKFTADIKFEEHSMKVTEGIEVTPVKGLSDVSIFVEVLKMSGVPYQKITGGTYYNFQPEANRDDASGFSLAVLTAKDGSIVTKLVQAGWGIGICK